MDITSLIFFFLGVFASIVLNILIPKVFYWLKPPYQQIETIKVGNIEVNLVDDLDETVRQVVDEVREQQKHPQVFVTSTKEDWVFAHRLVKDLRSLGIPVWTAAERMYPGDSLTAKLPEAIASSQWVIVIVSEGLSESQFARRELELALEAERVRGRTLVVPVWHQGNKLPPELEDRLVADFREDYQVGLQRLLATLRQTTEPARAEATESTKEKQRRILKETFGLTNREIAILLEFAHTGERSSARAIANKLGISLNTLKTHVRNISRKIGASTLLEAVEQTRNVLYKHGFSNDVPFV